MKLIRTLRKLVINSLGFSKTEANGLLILLALTVCLAIVPRIFINSMPYSADSARDLTSWAAEMNDAINSQDLRKKKEQIASTSNPQFFDPNTSSVSHLIASGVPELLAKRILLFREKGGRFRQAEDIRKIYGMPDNLALKLLPYVQIANNNSYTNFQRLTETSSPLTPKVSTINLNETTEEELQLVKGIGSVLSARIIKYRNRLGGFSSFDQLNEVYGLKPEVIAELTNRSSLSTNLTPLQLNTDSIKVLIRHPYIDYDLARIIINYRKVHGNFERSEDLQNIKVLSDSLYQKLYPYLSH